MTNTSETYYGRTIKTVSAERMQQLRARWKRLETEYNECNRRAVGYPTEQRLQCRARRDRLEPLAYRAKVAYLATDLAPAGPAEPLAFWPQPAALR